MQNFIPQYRTGYNVPSLYNTNLQQTPIIKTVAVTSKSEADNYIPDVNGTPTLFLNRGNNEIYLKQMDLNTGLGIFKEFTEKPQNVINEVITPLENNDFKKLSDKIDSLKSAIESLTTSKEETTETKGVKGAK